MSRSAAGRSPRASQRQARVETPTKLEDSSIHSIEPGAPIATAPAVPTTAPIEICAAEPGSTEPGSTEPGSTEPGSTEPGSAGPVAAAPADPAVEEAQLVAAVELEARPAAPAEPALEAAAEAEVQSPVNYDDEGIGEVEIDGQIYRFDSGKQGTALCLSLRRDGAWRWSYLGELRWDGRDLRSKALDRSLLTRLSASLRTLAEQAI